MTIVLLEASSPAVGDDRVEENVGIDSGGIAMALISAGTAVPTRVSQVFSTTSDNQSTLDVPLYRGNRMMARDNHALGTLRVEGIPPLPAGVPQIEMTLFGLEQAEIVEQRREHFLKRHRTILRSGGVLVG